MVCVDFTYSLILLPLLSLAAITANAFAMACVVWCSGVRFTSSMCVLVDESEESERRENDRVCSQMYLFLLNK